jgi:hypothetical protein
MEDVGSVRGIGLVHIKNGNSISANSSFSSLLFLGVPMGMLGVRRGICTKTIQVLCGSFGRFIKILVNSFHRRYERGTANS